MCQSKVKKDGPNRVSGKEKVPELRELREAVPKHCFERSLVKSTFFLARDLVVCYAIAYAAYNYLPMDDLTNPVQALGWTAYVLAEGTAMTGVWVVAHECGHQAYSDYKWVNDLVGYIFHTALLVPYFSWQYSHGVHHSRVNSILDGESHVPDIKRKVIGMYMKMTDALGEEAFALVQVVVHLVLGWPLYLAVGFTGAKRRPDGARFKSRPNHFNPYSELFPERMRFKAAVSTVGILAMLGLLVKLGMMYGTRTMVLMYWLPYLVVNAWLVTYTWLQHTHEDLPHFGEDEWSWMRGTLCTLDRPYPWLIDEMHHHIGTTHVTHHVFSKMPHYHAQEATEAMKPVLGDLYQFDPTPIHKALIETGKRCHFVDGVEGVQYMKSVWDERKAATKKVD
ncbi:Delta(12)-acyl-lipid-desaturase (Delta(12)-oleate desaturase) (PgFAD2) [Durusdinium trenchii]|uniref:Delta(12)-acyl-lipid-desaturase (Delta(12)-oleate desaturase) (PgFAD2) n=1 Tax=Durusdinium trenchii TaxID=1381693 RepID=A0ABP0NHY0_9DINO